MQVQRLAAPQQRVVRVVVRVRRVDEGSDGDGAISRAESDRRPSPCERCAGQAARGAVQRAFAVDSRGSVSHEAHHPDPLPERGADAPDHARRPSARGCGLRRRGVAGHRRRLHRPHDRGRARARRRPHRPADEQQGPRRRLPGGAGRVPQARRRRDRQHRRRQPVRRGRDPAAGRADPRGHARTWSSATARSTRSSTSRR